MLKAAQSEISKAEYKSNAIRLNYGNNGHTYYIVKDTIFWNAERTRLSATVNEFENGNLKDTVNWKIGRIIINGKITDEWRYTTNKMDNSHDCRVHIGDLSGAILQTCLNY